MFGRLATRVGKLEAQHAGMGHMREAVVRCAPIADSQAWAALLARLGWVGSQILVVLDATGAGSEPEVVVPPIPHGDMTQVQQAALARAGNGAGRWWVGNAARPTMAPVEAFDGLAALTAQLKEQRINSPWGYTGGL